VLNSRAEPHVRSRVAVRTRVLTQKYLLTTRAVLRFLTSSTDPHHSTKSQEILAISKWLESPAGFYTILGMVWTVSGAAMFLAFAGRITISLKLVAGGITFTALGVGRVFWICGNSLKRVIDESLDSTKRRRSSIGMEEAPVTKDVLKLISARSKTTGITHFIASQVRRETPKATMIGALARNRCGLFAIAVHLHNRSCNSTSMIFMTGTQLQYSSSSRTEGPRGYSTSFIDLHLVWTRFRERFRA